MWVYALSYPDTFEVFYVGRAINPSERLAKHCRDSRIDSKQPSKRVIKRLLLSKKRPQMTLLERCGFENVETVERKWVEHFHRQFDGMKNVLLVKPHENSPLTPKQ